MAAVRAPAIERRFPLRAGLGQLPGSRYGRRDFRFTPIVAIADADDLVEEYSGWGLRFETRKLGTRRLGASFEWS